MKECYIHLNEKEISVEVIIPLDGRDVLKEMKKAELEIIYKALRHTGGSRTKAANLLGIYRTTLVMRLPKHLRAVIEKMIKKDKKKPVEKTVSYTGVGKL